MNFLVLQGIISNLQLGSLMLLMSLPPMSTTLLWNYLLYHQLSENFTILNIPTLYQE